MTTPKQNSDTPPTEPGQKVRTGNLWEDFGPAFKRINVYNDLSRIGQIPCARNSLLSGIAGGIGIGFIRGMTAGPWIACNWAVGSFLFVSIGTWKICRNQLANEHKHMQVVVNSLPHLRRKQTEEHEKGEHE